MFGTRTLLALALASLQGAQAYVRSSHVFMLTFLFTTYTLQIDVLNITAPDGSAKASFISYGATATNLWVKDKVRLTFFTSIPLSKGLFKDGQLS
jgi:hypothetical protein